MSVNGIGALERGERRTPQRESLDLLARGLGLSADERRTFEAAAVRRSVPRMGGNRSYVAVGPWTVGRSTNLPHSLTTFVGRKDELRELASLVREQRLVTLTGAGGIGKTRAALEAGRAFLGDVLDAGVWLVELAPLNDPALVATAIASTLGIPEAAERAPIESLLGYFKHRKILLILDNCEHVIGEAARVAETLLRGCAALQILATSREQLNVQGEHIYRLDSLRVPSLESGRRLGSADVASYGAIVLFADRARAVERRFALTDENVALVAEICRRLDGIPLAIELAAARVNSLPLEALAQRLDGHYRPLLRGSRGTVPRQQTMRAAIDWSYDLLSPQERHVFENLSVFAGGCDLATATAVCSADEGEKTDVLEHISSLVEKSLVVVHSTGREKRYGVLEPFRQYAREKLATRGEADGLARRHARAFLERAERIERTSDRDPDWVMHEFIKEDLDNCCAALEWALVGRKDVVLGQRLVGALNLPLSHFARAEGERWILAALELVDDRTPPDVLAKLGLAQLRIINRNQEVELQLAASKNAIVSFERLGDDFAHAWAASFAGQALVSLGRFAEALTLLRPTLTRARTLCSHRLLSYTLRVTAWASVADGDFSAARRDLSEASAILRAIGADRAAAQNDGLDLSQAEFLSGDAESALRYASNALITLRAFNDTWSIAATLSSISVFLTALERFEEALIFAREALALDRELQLPAFVAATLQHFAANAVFRPLATGRRDPESLELAARLLGFYEARFAALGAPIRDFGKVVHGSVLTALQDAIDPVELVACMSAGALMTEDAAIEMALTL